MALRDPREFDSDLDKLIEKYDRSARKDATINMRISSRELELIRKAAKCKGFNKYQKWLHQIISNAVEEALDLTVDDGDDF